MTILLFWLIGTLDTSPVISANDIVSLNKLTLILRKHLSVYRQTSLTV